MSERKLERLVRLSAVIGVMIETPLTLFFLDAKPARYHSLAGIKKLNQD
jgi:hypothetical protein